MSLHRCGEPVARFSGEASPYGDVEERAPRVASVLGAVVVPHPAGIVGGCGPAELFVSLADAGEGYQGCIGRTLDRISIFPDGRAYVCSYLFDTDMYFAQMNNGQVVLNRTTERNEFDLFTLPLLNDSCGGCGGNACMGGCPAEEIVMGASSCATYPDIVPVCRLWKSSAKPE
ncbi:hypothetical protein [Nocardia salmonicida]|uniref:hypothetical protein n=1 Tax=Nocardia salmonicida TaxID=53431 RepID=UPI003419A27A